MWYFDFLTRRLHILWFDRWWDNHCEERAILYNQLQHVLFFFSDRVYYHPTYLVA